MLKPEDMSPDHLPGVYRITRPRASGPVVFDSPHSGRTYPGDFHAACPPDVLRQAEDSRLDDLLAGITAQGVTLLCAEFPRTYIDVNREAGDIDPELLAGSLPPDAAPTTRSAAGIGLIRRLIRPGVPVYDRKLDMAEVAWRIDRYYHPYHRALSALIEGAHYNFGAVWHVDCHSMPATGRGQADFVLGDRDGTSCAPGFTRALHDLLKAEGYKVAINQPYKGVEIVRRHGRPEYGYHSLQLEVSKALYWNEDRQACNRRASATAAVMDRIAAFCMAFATDNALPLAAD